MNTRLIRKVSNGLMLMGCTFLIGSMVAINASNNGAATRLLEIGMTFFIFGGLAMMAADVAKYITDGRRKSLRDADQMIQQALNACADYEMAEQLAEKAIPNYHRYINDQLYGDTVQEVQNYLLAARQIMDQM